MDTALGHALHDPAAFSAAVWPEKRLRGLQIEPARAGQSGAGPAALCRIREGHGPHPSTEGNPHGSR